MLIYDETEDGIPQLKSLGLIWVSKSFSKIIIQITDEDYANENQKLYVIAPANSLERAQSIIKDTL